MLGELIPVFEPYLGPRPVEKALSRQKGPVSVSFRPGSDFQEVIAAIKAHRGVVVEASPGAGKSTVLPAAIAKSMGVLVLHVFPNERLADHVNRYVSSRGDKVPLLLTPKDPYPKTGVAMMSAACLVSKWLEAGEVVLPECVLFHDESHCSDAYTYLVKLCSLESPAVRSYVQATATVGAAGYRSLESKGELSKAGVDAPVTAWDPYDNGKPWSVNSLRGNALLFVDSKTSAGALADTYAQAGFKSFRLSSRTPLSEFRLAEQAVSDPSGPICVLVADSSYRSGFTLDVSVILDSGKISRLEIVGGRPVRRERGMYQLESFQAAARGARIGGSRCIYYSPVGVTPEPMICDLEDVEAEAAVLIVRMLGYRVPAELAQCKMASSSVPADLCSALRGAQPLCLLRPEALVSLADSAVPTRTRSPFLAEGVEPSVDEPLDVKDYRVSADVARERGEHGYRKSRGKHDSAWDSSWQSDLVALLKQRHGVETPEIGKAYYASGLATDDCESMAFPDGPDSVFRFAAADQSGRAFQGLDAWHRSVAVNMMLSRQQALAAELDGIGRAMRAAREDGRVLGTRSAVNLATQLAERLAQVSAALTVVNDLLWKAGEGFCSYHEMEIDVSLSDEVFSGWMSLWKALPGARLEAPKVAANYHFGSGAARAMHAVAGAAGRAALAEREYVPMPTQGQGMRAIAGASWAPVVVGSRSDSSSQASDDRCEGATYWKQSVVRNSYGALAMERTLVCSKCGVNANRRKHGR